MKRPIDEIDSTEGCNPAEADRILDLATSITERTRRMAESECGCAGCRLRRYDEGR